MRLATPSKLSVKSFVITGMQASEISNGSTKGLIHQHFQSRRRIDPSRSRDAGGNNHGSGTA